jgi:hypothetical protein
VKSRFLALFAFVAILGGTARAQIPYDMCGTMVQGVTCPLLFDDTNGHLWLLDNTGGFQLGDVVHVVGTATPGCISICQQGNGCIQVGQISSCNPSPGTSFCPGDGSGTNCPCGNNSPAGQGAGCLHSLGTGGLLAATGTASVSTDTVVLQGSGMPNASALYFQGTTQLSLGQGTAFGDGLRCVGGTIVRLGTKTNAAGASQYPAAGDPSVSVKGGVAAGDVRHYQVWYRNAATFCTTSTFNLTNGFSITWSS